MISRSTRSIAVSSAIVRLRDNRNNTPLVLVEHGKPIQHRLRKEQVSTDDILAAAREKQGLLELEQIEYAILETSGGISVIPARQGSEQDN